MNPFALQIATKLLTASPSSTSSLKSPMTIMDFLSNPYFFAVLSVALALLFFQILFRKVNKSHRKKYHPVAGTVFNQLLNFNRLHHYMTDLAGKYKTYRLLNPFRNEIYTADPVNVEYILKTNFENYGKVETLLMAEWIGSCLY